MKAIIKTGGKQYLVEEGSVIYVEKLNAEEGKNVTFDEVLMLDGKVGSPVIEGAKITGKVSIYGHSEVCGSAVVIDGAEIHGFMTIKSGTISKKY